MHAACVHVVCLHVHRWCVHACALCDACARVWSLSVSWRPQGGPQRPRGASRGCHVQGRWTPVFWAGEALARSRCPRSRCPRGWRSSRDPATGSAACPGGTPCPVTPSHPHLHPSGVGPAALQWERRALGRAGPSYRPADPEITLCLSLSFLPHRRPAGWLPGTQRVSPEAC